MTTGWAFIAALHGFFAVLSGAFAAHGLRHKLSPDMLAIFETASRYQMYHALALLAVAWLAANGRATVATTAAGIAMAVGVVIFSGSLYLLALTGVRWLGAITPVGGLGFLVGWLALAWAALRR
jgi:uncharacterized membrane protein YgdD (TMEM256/DUF423 family)